MARRKRKPMSEGKKNIIAELIEEYDIQDSKGYRGCSQGFDGRHYTGNA